MEQTNLVVTSDGKSWDEVTRNTSYIGNLVLQTNTDTHSTGSTVKLFDEWRGNRVSEMYNRPAMNKDFAISYDRQICLNEGQYKLHVQTAGLDGVETQIKINGSTTIKGLNHGASSDKGTVLANCVVQLQRGDYIQILGVVDMLQNKMLKMLMI